MFTHHCRRWIAVALLATGRLLFGEPPAPTYAVSPFAQFLTDHGYVQTQVNSTGRNQDLVQACINGSVGTLALDTGCGRTCITDGFARRLKLDVQKGSSLVGAGGKVAGAGMAALTSFTLNNIAINRISTIEVLPPHVAVPKDGLLGYDYMRLNAMILPVGRSFLLYKPGPAPPAEFDSFLKALGYSAIPLTFGEGGLRATGSLDGHPLIAIVDCGATFSLFDSTFVKNTVGALVSKSSMVYWGIDGRPMYVDYFQAGKLTFGALTFPPTTSTATNGTTLNAIHAQALLGYDLLAVHKAIIDLGHDVLWMK